MSVSGNFLGIKTIIDEFLIRINSGFEAGLPYVHYLVYLLLSIDVVILGIKAMFGEGANLGSAVRKILFVGFWLYLVLNIQDIASSLLSLLIDYGMVVGAGKEALVQSSSESAQSFSTVLTAPMIFIEKGIVGLVDMYTAIPLSFINIGNKILGLIVMLLGTLCFGYIYILMVITLVEFHLLLLCSSLLLAFCFMEQTKFLGEKALTAVATVAIRLMVLIIIIGITMPLVISAMESHTSLIEDNLTILNFLYILILVIFSAYICAKSTSLASALTGSGASIAPSGVMGMLAGAAAGIITNVANIKKEDGKSKLEGLKKGGRAVAGGIAETMGASRQAKSMGKSPLKAGMKAAGHSLVRSTTGVSEKYLKSRYMQGRAREGIES